MTGPHAYGDYRGEVLGVNSTGGVTAAGGVRDLDLNLAEVGGEGENDGREQRHVLGGDRDKCRRTWDIVSRNREGVNNDNGVSDNGAVLGDNLVTETR